MRNIEVLVSLLITGSEDYSEIIGRELQKFQSELPNLAKLTHLSRDGLTAVVNALGDGDSKSVRTQLSLLYGENMENMVLELASLYHHLIASRELGKEN